MKDRELKVFFIYLTSLFALLLPVFYFRYINPSAELRLIFLRIFLVIEFTALSLVFYYNLQEKLLKRIILIIPFIFIVFSLYDYLKSPSDKFSYKPLATECLILLIYIIYFFYEKIQLTTFIPIYQTNMFWIAVAFTLYCSGNFFLFLYSNNAVQSPQFLSQYTLIYSTFTILKNILLSIGVTIKQPKGNNQYNDLATHHDFPDLTNDQDNTY